MTTLFASENLIVFTILGDKLPEEDVDDLISEADKNGDCALDYEEFVQMLTSDY